MRQASVYSSKTVAAFSCPLVLQNEKYDCDSKDLLVTSKTWLMKILEKPLKYHLIFFYTLMRRCFYMKNILQYIAVPIYCNANVNFYISCLPVVQDSLE